VNQNAKEEVQKLLAQLQPPHKSRLSALFLKIGAGYAAMAVFTTAALIYSSFNLYLITRTARQIVDTDLPVVMALIEMRSSLLAQESFAGRYAIFRDPIFIQLFQQRKEDLMANLDMLEKANSVQNITSLKRLYFDYQTASERLFTGKSRSRGELKASALRLMNALDQLYIERQGILRTELQRSDAQRESTTRWTIGISCTGFLLALFIAPLAFYRVIRALGKLQKETHRIASGDFNYHPQVPAIEEISDLASDFNEMAAKIKKMEQMNQDARPLTPLPGNLAIERVLDERLKSRTPFSLCHLELENFHPFQAQYGYARAGALLHEMGVLVHRSVAGFGATEDFAGHAGGDKFVMVVTPERVASVCEAVVKGFDAEVLRHVNAEDRDAKAIRRCDGGGGEMLSPITTVSISVLDCDIDAYASAVEVSRAVLGLKDSLKNNGVAFGKEQGGQEGEPS